MIDKLTLMNGYKISRHPFQELWMQTLKGFGLLLNDTLGFCMQVRTDGALGQNGRLHRPNPGDLLQFIGSLLI